MSILLSLANMALERKRNETPYSLYLRHFTIGRYKIHSISPSTTEGTFVVKTSPIYENLGIFTDEWTELVFVVEDKPSEELLEDLGYSEFQKEGISVLNFLKIKATGANLCSYFSVKDGNVNVEKRVLDINNWYDVMNILEIYKTKTYKYESLVIDMKMTELDIEMGKEEYERDKLEYQKWKKQLNSLPDSDSDNEDGAE